MIKRNNHNISLFSKISGNGIPSFSIVMIICLAVGNACRGQDTTDYQYEKQLIQILLKDEHTLDSIVDRTLNNSYTLKSLQAEVTQKQEALTQSKRSWLSSFIVGVNVFSQSTAFDETTQTSVTTAGFLPNMGVSLNVNPEKLVNLKSNARMARQDIVRAENAMKEQRRALRVFIVGKYYEYLEALSVLELRYNTYETQRESKIQAQQKFKRGEATYEEVLLAQNGLINAEESLMKAEIFTKKLKKELQLYTSDSEATQP